MGPKGPNGKIVLIRFVHVHKKYKTRVGDRQRKSGYCGILAQKVSVRPYARINYAPLSNLTMYTTGFKLNKAYAVNLCTRFLNLLSPIIRQFEIGLLTELSRLLVSTWSRTINRRNNHSQMKSFKSCDLTSAKCRIVIQGEFVFPHQ